MQIRPALVVSLCLGLVSNYAVALDKITQEEIRAAQQEWAKAVVAIGDAYTKKEDYKAVATKVVDELYAYDEGTVLFKPTKASEHPFRLTEEDAISYFVGGKYTEDHGFALNPWSKVRFDDENFVIDSDSALAMGSYYFTNPKTGHETKVEFTFGYQRGKDGKLLINLHHSSLPYHPQH